MGWFSGAFKECTSEPAVFVYSFAIGIYGTIIPNFLLQKVCCPDVEPPLDYNCSDVDALKEATDITTLRNTIREFVPILILLLAGSWRDATGRNKPLIYLGLIGEVIGVAVELFGAWKWTISPWHTSIVASTLYGLAGGSKLFYVGATCAITDHSSEENRTTRYTIYQGAAYLGSCLSSALSGYCLNFLGYQWLFVFVISLHLLTVILVVIMKRDINEQINGGRIGIFKKMKSAYKSRPNNCVIWLMLVSCIIVNVASLAEGNLFLYFLNKQFNFTVVEAGLYSSFRLIFGIVSTTALSPVFTKVFKWTDFKIGIICSGVTLISTTLMVFAKTVMELIGVSLLDFLKIFVFTLPMSIVTKCVKNDEVGVFVSLRFIGGCILPIFFFYFYDYVFSATSESLPGTFFLISSGVMLIAFISFCLCPFIYKITERNTLRESVTKVEDVEKCEEALTEECKYLTSGLDNTTEEYNVEKSGEDN